ncbi:MAG TPA: hypothetical protein VJT09_16610 [Pyrinomonadaceae bacterium]|nr:hypothetical protein [Pyrinomonadaceae bacterium]
MFPRHLFLAKLSCALFILCLLASACSNKRDSGLTQQRVATLLDKWQTAQKSDDITGVVDCLSRKFHYKMTFKNLGPTETRAGDYEDYVEDTKRGFSEGQMLSSERTVTMIAVNPDGQGAQVMSEVHDTYNFDGRLFRTVSMGTTTVELEDGKAVITAIDHVVSPDSGNRQQVFQSNYD